MSGQSNLLIITGVGIGIYLLTRKKSTVAPPTGTTPCVDSTWACNNTDGLEHSNCGNTRTTTSCTNGYQALQMVLGIIPEDLRYDVNNNGIVDTGDGTLLMQGTPLRSLKPANIVSTSFPTPTIPVGTYNTVAIDITWTNTGETSGSFIPQVKIGTGTPINLDSSITLAHGAVYRKTMTLTGVTAGNQSICPLPNTVVSCKTIDIPTLPTVCYKGVVINMTPCPWSWGAGNNFWVQAVPVGQTWTYQNCYSTLEAAKTAIDALVTYTFNQCSYSYLYAANDGSTPIGTIVYVVGMVADNQGTIVAWTGSMYTVNLPAFGLNMNYVPTSLKLTP